MHEQVPGLRCPATVAGRLTRVATREVGITWIRTKWAALPRHGLAGGMDGTRRLVVLYPFNQRREHVEVIERLLAS